MNILGLNAYHGDAAAALLADGQLVYAIEEERIRRIKHWAGFPRQAALACLQAVDGNVDAVAISRNPRANLAGKLRYVASHPRSFLQAMSRAKNTVRVANVAAEIAALGVRGARPPEVHHVEHHRAHMGSAFYASPFEEAAVVSVDGFGDFRSVMWGAGRENAITTMGAVSFPHSLGAFYTAFTQLLGFAHYGDEYKMMGLAAFGKPLFADKVRQVVRMEGDQVLLDLSYFQHHTAGTAMTWEGGIPEIGPVFSARLTEIFGAVREAGEEIGERHADIAASVQLVFEECYFQLLRHVQAKTGLRRLCLAGGVALNCAANGKILAETAFRQLYVQPAANDAGTSIGAALCVWHEEKKQPRSLVMSHAYFGPSYSHQQMRAAVLAAGLEWSEVAEDELVTRTARYLSEGKVLGWFQGRMEFGPRALGNRSILADPRRADMKEKLNRRIKFREGFRPYCPSVAAEHAAEFFVDPGDAPFMVTTALIRPEKRALLPAITHADGTGRLQTVEKAANPLYWKLLNAFGQITGVPVLINTSFNENEPIVHTPEQAIHCFLRTEMDVLVLGPAILVKAGGA